MHWFIIAFISAVFSAASAVTQKKVLFKIEVHDFVIWTSIFNLLFSLPYFFYLDSHALTLINLSVLFGKSILGALSYIFIMKALKNLEISGALPLMVLTPGLVAIFGIIFIGDYLNAYQSSGIILLMVGTYLLEMKPKQSIFEPFKVFNKSQYYHYIGFALLLQSVSSVLDKLLLGKYKMPPITFMAFQQLFYLIIITVWVLAQNKKLKISWKPTGDVIYWIILIAVLTIGYRYSQILAVKKAPVAAVLSIKRISVFMATLAGGRLFKESNLFQKAVATFLMVLGAILIMED